ncbi:uncharacterized protein LOC132744444 [Ruditapes philippinarum]|uniref:uncharacterized protein LOC132744444 n=1 Tax=Ruditapes philippinarum TaxID=129788 RepID=UPI00295B7525|nr:uncharacterized protein LOC132744444 [Ruditapes philippinarum]
MSLASNFVLVFAVIVGLTAASDLHCCMSKKIYGKGLIVTATLKNGSSSPVMTQNSFLVESNVDKKMQAVNGSIITMSSAGSTHANYQVIRDFQHMKTYNIDGDKCLITQIVGEEMPDGCVSRELNFTGKYMYGSTEVNGWYGFVGGQHVTMTTTVNECIFMSSTRMGMMADGTKITETVQLVDVVQYQNSYDQVFDLPQSCKQAASTVG